MRLVPSRVIPVRQPLCRGVITPKAPCFVLLPLKLKRIHEARVQCPLGPIAPKRPASSLDIIQRSPKLFCTVDEYAYCIPNLYTILVHQDKGTKYPK